MDLSSRSERLMGTTITVSICHPQADELLTHCFELLRSYEHRFSANDASSELMEINHQAGIAPVRVHPDLFELIALGTLHSQAFKDRSPTDSTRPRKLYSLFETSWNEDRLGSFSKRL